VITNYTKLASTAALFLAILFWDYSAEFELPFRFLVSIGAILVARQAFGTARRAWALAFLVVAAIFNPFVSVITASGRLSLVVVGASLITFVLSVYTLKVEPLLSPPSIIAGGSAGESL
jgi:hypothetical protein